MIPSYFLLFPMDLAAVKLGTGQGPLQKGSTSTGGAIVSDSLGVSSCSAKVHSLQHHLLWLDPVPQPLPQCLLAVARGCVTPLLDASLPLASLRLLDSSVPLRNSFSAYTRSINMVRHTLCNCRRTCIPVSTLRLTPVKSISFKEHSSFLFQSDTNCKNAKCIRRAQHV